MELKDYQQTVLKTLDDYLDTLRTQQTKAQKIQQANVLETDPDLIRPVPDYPKETWDMMRKAGKLPLARTNIPFSPRIDGIGRAVPSVCFKIPTGGGKTILAAHAVSKIQSRWLQRNHGFVLWIVPNESIYTQTLKALRDRQHPYRQILDRASAGKTKILEKQDGLNSHDVDSQLCVMLLMLQSANRETKESLRLFRDRGNVHGFFPSADDVLLHAELLDQIPNLDVYGDSANIGAVIKESLGNVLRLTQPVVVLDEGHKGYSKLALQTLYGFNPSFVLELTATPVDRTSDTPPMYSNWLVDVRGTDLDKEDMVKLPINVTVRGGDDWRVCLRESVERLNVLQHQAEHLRAESARYIRPICLVQVERTGKDQRDGLRVHAEDAKDYLLSLGISQEQIAIKTSEKNELNQPENLDLFSPTNQVRFIITKQALQEGWDCSFAYVLCSLTPVSSSGAMTQLVGRILRQPDATKTTIPALDECYVFCFHSKTGEVVDAIRKGLEQDGMADLVASIRDAGGEGGSGNIGRTIMPREKFLKTKIYLPKVLWIDADKVRDLEYETDILYRIDWSEINLEGLAATLPKAVQAATTQVVRIGLEDDPNSKDFIQSETVKAEEVDADFDPAYVTRAIVDVVTNPWIARSLVGKVLADLEKLQLSAIDWAAMTSVMIESLRARLSKERDRLAEVVFLREVQAGRIQFRLRTDKNNWRMPNNIPTQRQPDSPLLQRGDGKVVEHSFFDPVYRDDLNGYEQKVATYLDSEKALKWWHRNVAKSQSGYGLQGWQKHKIYPDFIFALSHQDGHERFMVLETKGDHLNNPDTAYKKKLLEVCTDAFQLETLQSAGELELLDDDGVKVRCALIFESTWQTDLAKLIEDTVDVAQ
ncbi:DEAD/DEAH box helicase family protein [Methylomonas sp. EbB]|uniref:DEAD/DEAH box helicase family protein n=2 Tax=Methylomonas fluvii TaxID=1854564 RepID=A0ABR9DFU1_9GAMM|nr:DEAD/DEAH box helicase family protein [Methylomonas fluvii]